MDDLSNRESHVGDGVLHGLQENRDHVLGNLLLGDMSDDLLQRRQAAHSIVVTLLVNIISLDNFGNESSDNPVALELISQLFSLADTSVSDRGSCVA